MLVTGHVIKISRAGRSIALETTDADIFEWLCGITYDNLFEMGNWLESSIFGKGENSNSKTVDMSLFDACPSSHGLTLQVGRYLLSRQRNLTFVFSSAD